jgi:ribosomal protein L37AE/L43A
MASFKLSKKAVHTDTRMSIIAKHDKTIQDIEKEKKNINKYTSELKSLYSTKEKTKDLLELRDLENKIELLEKKIDAIKNETDLTEYLFNAMEFIEHIDSDTYTNENFNRDGEIFKYIKLDSSNNKEELYNMYMVKCFPQESREYHYFRNEVFICKDCGASTTRDVSSGVTVCYTCGLTAVNNISNIPEWNYTESHEYIKPYSYKRTNHFKEWIIQIQGREGTNVPDEVLQMLILEIKKERLTDKTLITFYKIKEFLKKLKLNKYYEHIPNIIHKITGAKQLMISHELESKLTDMFNEIQEPFEKHCPNNRKNFLSYSYTLYKFFQLLNKNDYLIYFPLLKSRDKLFEQENIWKGICKELNWKFISCI